MSTGAELSRVVDSKFGVVTAEHCNSLVVVDGIAFDSTIALSCTGEGQDTFSTACDVSAVVNRTRKVSFAFNSDGIAVVEGAIKISIICFDGAAVVNCCVEVNIFSRDGTGVVDSAIEVTISSIDGTGVVDSAIEVGVYGCD